MSTSEKNEQAGDAGGLVTGILVLTGFLTLFAVSAGGVGGFLYGPLAGAGLAVYLLPTIAALKHQKHNRQAIVMLNLLLGWTVIGWVIAMVWAFARDTVLTHDVTRADDATAASQPTKTCPFCAEPVRMQAIKCKHCGSELKGEQHAV